MSGAGLRVLVCGGREYHNALTLGSWLGGIHKDHGIACIIEGGARGADRLALYFARSKGIPVETYPVQWDRDGPAGGPIRNQRMLDEGKPDLVVAFPGGRGTADMVRRARKAGVRVVEVPRPLTDEP